MVKNFLQLVDKLSKKMQLFKEVNHENIFVQISQFPVYLQMSQLSILL
jgi:hypothetical protein